MTEKLCDSEIFAIEYYWLDEFRKEERIKKIRIGKPIFYRGVFVPEYLIRLGISAVFNMKRNHKKTLSLMRSGR